MSDDETPSDTLAFGTDSEGRTHAYSRLEHTVFVSNGDVYELDETPLETVGDWADHVRGTCGWRECRIADGSGFDVLAKQVQSAVETEAGP